LCRSRSALGDQVDQEGLGEHLQATGSRHRSGRDDPAGGPRHQVRVCDTPSCSRRSP
jgi:hypothetical protein